MNTKKLNYISVVKLFYLILLIMCISSWAYSLQGSRLATTTISLKGNATGGILTLIELPNRNVRHVSVFTEPGESSESVASRLADIINDLNPFEWGGTFEVNAEGGSLLLLGKPGTYAFTGTEEGLGIPDPPTSLSGQHDLENNTVTLHWQNPESGYDNICVAKFGYPVPTYTMIDGSSETYISSIRTIRNKNNESSYCCVIGIRDGVPSAPAAIYLTDNVQEELFGIPFSDGIAPNWKAWSTYEGIKIKNELIKPQTIDELTVAKGRRYNPVKNPNDKPFKQILRTSESGGMVGIWRKFLGLTAGHTYRLTARLNTLNMEPNDSDWSYSLHAVLGDGTWKNPTASQFANPNTGRMKSLGNTITTHGEYIQQSIDIKLPENVDSITVWLCLQSEKNAAEVAFDYIKLEDLGT